MQALPHHYAALGVSLDASPEAIKLAWRESAQRWHPDALSQQGKTGQVRFQAAQEAYRCLSDLALRTTYEKEVQAQIDHHLGELRTRPLAAFIGNFVQPRTRTLERGADRKLLLEIALDEIVRGCKRHLTLAVEQGCRSCDGIGCDELGRPLICQACWGIGERFESGFIRSSWSECTHCMGRGFEPSQGCKTCLGRGRALEDQTLVITVAAGQAHGSLIRLPRSGEPSEVGGEPGDLLVEVRHLPSVDLSLDGYDLHLQRTIPFWLALTGGPLRVDTPHGIARLQIPPLSPDQTRLRLPEWGVRHAQGQGDAYLTLTVEWPAQLSDEARDSLERWGKSLHPDMFPVSSQQAERIGIPKK